MVHACNDTPLFLPSARGDVREVFEKLVSFMNNPKAQRWGQMLAMTIFSVLVPQHYC